MPEDSQPIRVTPHPRSERRVDVDYAGKPGASYLVRWGDGDINMGTVGAKPPFHVYDRAGAYQVRIHDYDTNAFLAQTLVVIRGGRSPKGYEVGRDAENTNIVEIRFVDTDDGTGVLPHFAVEWPKTKDRITAWAVPGQKIRRLLPDGQHTVPITDLTSHRVANEAVTVEPPEYDPDYVIRRKAGGDALTAQVEITKTSGKDLVLSWDEEGSAPEVHKTPAVGATFEHTYRDPGENQSSRHLVQVAYDDGSGESKTSGITVPLA